MGTDDRRSLIFDDLEAEQDALDAVLAALTNGAWSHESGASGWSVADVVLHLAQSEEVVVASSRDDGRATEWRQLGSSVDDAMEAMVRAERGNHATPASILERWRTARRAAVDALRGADPDQPLVWVAAALKPGTLATTRLAETWAHALDITGPLGIAYPDTVRLAHIAWLGHRTLPYALTRAGEPPRAVRCDLMAPDGTTWHLGPPDADSVITGPVGDFCRVGARRLAPERSRLVTRGPHAATALRVLRNYADM